MCVLFLYCNKILSLCSDKKRVSMGKYAKPPLTYREQVELLKSRGMIFADEQRAKKQLANYLSVKS